MYNGWVAYAVLCRVYDMVIWELVVCTGTYNSALPAY